MKRSLDNILGYRLRAKDGDFGVVHDFLLDDLQWTLRYLVIKTGGWLRARRILLAPAVLGKIDAELREVRVDLTREQLRHKPGIEADQPVALQQERLLNQRYGWPSFWMPEILGLPLPDKDSAPGDPHLRSFREMQGYHLTRRRERLAKVTDLIISERNWSVALLAA